jgi:LPS-assembly protein
LTKLQGIVISADSTMRDNEKDTAELEGNVQIISGAQHIKADKAIVFLRKKNVQLYGHVEITSAKNRIVGDQVFLDYENNTGVIYNGLVTSGNVVFSGDVLEKTGESEFFVNHADYTSCTNCPSTWSFNGTTIRAELGGYAYIKNAVLRIADIPIFWLPYLVVPLKSDRQTGLLTPEFESSNNGGFAIAQPFFWAINRSSDATATVKNYDYRGLKLLGEYRYVLNDNSKGSLEFASIYDRAFGVDPRLNNYRDPSQSGQPIERWFTRYEHYYEMPDNIIQRADVNLASDLQYPKDFPLETLNFGDPAMENRFSFTKNTKDQVFFVDSSYYVNMLQGDPLSGNDNAVHRLPELHFSQVEKNIGHSDFIYNIDLDYVNFTRSGNAYDDMVYKTVNGTNTRVVHNACANGDTDVPNWQDRKDCHQVYDGSYDSTTDLMRTGQRLDFKPGIYYPIKVVDGFDITPGLSYRETHYYFNVGDDADYVRRYLRDQISARMSFSSIYGDTVNPKATRYKHEIIPEISYTNIPWIEQRNQPFFGNAPLDAAPYSPQDYITDGDLGSPYGIQFDYNDRVYDRNLTTFALTNKITEKRWVGDRPEYRQIASLKLAQSYNSAKTLVPGEQPGTTGPLSDLSAILDIRLDHFQTYSTFNYYPYQNVTNTSSRVRLLNDMGQFFQVQLTKQYQITPGQEVITSNRVEDYTFSAGFLSRYINLMGRVVYDANWERAVNQQKIKSWAYIAQFKPPGDCWLITFIQDQVTGGDSSTRVAFEFNFDGTPKPPLPPEALDAFGF